MTEYTTVKTANTLNRDNVPERNQEPTEKGEIKLLDVPEHNLKREKLARLLKFFQTAKRMRLNSVMITDKCPSA